MELRTISERPIGDLGTRMNDAAAETPGADAGLMGKPVATSNVVADVKPVEKLRSEDKLEMEGMGKKNTDAAEGAGSGAYVVDGPMFVDRTQVDGKIIDVREHERQGEDRTGEGNRDRRRTRVELDRRTRSEERRCNRALEDCDCIN